MRLRFQFVVLFSLLFTVLLVFTALFVYFFFRRESEKDFSRRLWAQAYYTYGSYYHVALPDSVSQVLSDYHPNTINQLQIFLVDKTGAVTYTNIKNGAAIPAKLPLQNIRNNKFSFVQNGAIQTASLYIPAPKESYVMVSGYDKNGTKKVQSLAHILLTVVVIGISLIVFSAIVIVNLVTKPLIRLGVQMQGITEKNLQDRILVKAGRLNYEESQIAIHFNAMLDRLEKAFEIQKSFVHHASHELRTPLATMFAQTELALRKDLTIAEARKTLESLKDDQQEMIELTNSLLLLSRYEKDQTSPDWPVVRLDELLYDTMGMVKRMLPNVNVSLEFAHVPDSELFLSIQGNDSLIRSAFRNLIKNAWLYSDNKSVAITIDSGNSDIYLHFDNTGNLLSLEEQERLFVPFFRASNSVQKKGFGLGLNIIERIIALHNGNISYIIFNNLNRFTLQFPKLQQAEGIEL